jgi:hypothetical protein
MVNFGNFPEKNFQTLEQFRQNIPHMCCEYYPGWFNHWGDFKLVHTNPLRIKQIAADLEWMITHNKSFSLYMVHGGTNFGFSAGANHHHNYQPDITSYDYSAPISEAGGVTDQFTTYRELLARHQPAGAVLPPIPEAPPRISIPCIDLVETAPLYYYLPPPQKVAQIHPMEYYDQNYGLINYSTQIISPFQGRSLRLVKVQDFAYVFLNGKQIATFDRRKTKDQESTLKIPSFTGESAKLDILVESHGRINYGSYILDRKGITDYVAVNEPFVLMDWEVSCIPCDAAYLTSLAYRDRLPNATGPMFHRGQFTLETTGDTFLDCSSYRKGMVWVNGHNLGRFWEIGPQTRLYLPGCWLKTGENEVIVLDMLGPQPAKALKKLGKKNWKQIPQEKLQQNTARPPICAFEQP